MFVAVKVLREKCLIFVAVIAAHHSVFSAQFTVTVTSIVCCHTSFEWWTLEAVLPWYFYHRYTTILLPWSLNMCQYDDTGL